MEQQSEEYLKKFHLPFVPGVEDKDLKTGESICLNESHTILRYLVETRNCADHWYPKDLKTRCKVDQFLDWHQTFLR